jgi:hypothetical protein
MIARAGPVGKAQADPRAPRRARAPGAGARRAGSARDRAACCIVAQADGMQQGVGMVRRTLLSAALAAVLLAPAAASAAADSGPSPATFADVVASSRLIVLADVVRRPDGGIDLEVERVVKGHPSSTTLRFPPTPQAAIQPGWGRVVVAFSDPAEIDFRAPTIAWHVDASGALDPERYQQRPGTPQTLAALLAWFGLPATDAPSAARPPAGPGWRPAVLALAGVASLAWALRHGRASSPPHVIEPEAD